MGKRRDSSNRVRENDESVEASRNEFVNLVNELFDHFDKEVVSGRRAAKSVPGEKTGKSGIRRFRRESKAGKAALRPSQPVAGQGYGNNWDKRFLRGLNEDFVIPEVFKVLRERILHPAQDGKIPRTIMVTSSLPREGKTFVAANLAASLAGGMDQHALLVDCDLRRPSVAKLFGIRGDEGLVDYLRDGTELHKLFIKTILRKLSVLPAGTSPVNPAELLSSARMSRLVAELAARYEDRMIIFDTPPVMVAAETRVLARCVDGVIVVVREGKAGKEQILQTIDAVGRDKLIGFVYNDNQINVFEKAYGYGYRNRYSYPRDNE